MSVYNHIMLSQAGGAGKHNDLLLFAPYFLWYF